MNLDLLTELASRFTLVRLLNLEELAPIFEGVKEKPHSQPTNTEPSKLRE